MLMLRLGTPGPPFIKEIHMQEVPVIVTDRDYDVEFGVDEFNVDLDDPDDLVMADAVLFDEWCTMYNRVIDLEDYFGSLLSKNQLDRIMEREARLAAEEVAQEKVREMLKCAPDFSGRKPRSLNIGEIH
jgi:PHD/YefM family antitoxin component YafN of YafNO toxin-antitoxin module